MKFYTYKKIIIVNNFSHQNFQLFILEIFVFSWTLKPIILKLIMRFLVYVF